MLMKLCICFGICLSSNLFSLRLTFFSNLELIVAQQTGAGNVFLNYVNETMYLLEICLSSRFMSIVLWPKMTPLVPFYLKMHVVTEGPGATVSVLRCLIYLTSSLLTCIKCLAKN